LTFDDGYRSVITQALPVLASAGVPAMLYVIGGRIGGDNQWPGQWPGLGTQPLATAEELRAWIAAGFDVGGHSWSHPRLPHLNDASLADEVEASADRLERQLGCAVAHFAYPYGDYGAREVARARRRYRTATTTEVRAVCRGDGAHELPRIDGHDVSMLLRWGLGGGRRLDWYLTCRRTLRRVRRRVEAAHRPRGRTPR
jgi:peptidoglycan/xylan/chitin deacetylase (PgdA/CDA1 family)